MSQGEDSQGLMVLPRSTIADALSASFPQARLMPLTLSRDSGVASRTTPWWEELECRSW